MIPKSIPEFFVSFLFPAAVHISSLSGPDLATSGALTRGIHLQKEGNKHTMSDVACN